jgi:hypothetical protein
LRAAADYRLLAASLANRDGDEQVQTLLFIDTRDRGAAPVVAANVAAALAQTEERVVLVDADPGDGHVASALERIRRGNRAASATANEPSGPSGLPSLLTVQAIPSRVDGDIGGLPRDQVERLIGNLRGGADRVIVHASATSRSVDPMAWAREVDGVVVVVERDEARRDDVVRLVESLRYVGAELVGWILTDARLPGHGWHIAKVLGAQGRRSERVDPSRPSGLDRGAAAIQLPASSPASAATAPSSEVPAGEDRLGSHEPSPGPAEIRTTAGSGVRRPRGARARSSA